MAEEVFGGARFRLEGRNVLAHRHAYELLKGPIPEGMQLDHTCHNADPACRDDRNCRHRKCVNPDHLDVVTNRVNILRGKTLPAKQAARTHCPRGHPYTEANTYLYRGKRQCRACRRKEARA